MKSKRFISLMLSVCMILVIGMSGCGKKTDSSTSSKKETDNVSSVDSQTDTPSDNSDISDATDSSSQEDASSEEESDSTDTYTEPDNNDVSSTPTSGGNGSSLKVSKKLKPLTASGDLIMQSNPDRGFRTHMTLYVNEAAAEADPMKYYQKDYDVFFGYCNMDIKVALTYLYLTEYRGMDIPKKGMQAIEKFFQFCELKGFTACLRFAYCDDLNHLERGADQATIVRHIKQLAPLIKKYKHCVHTVEGGFLGSYGEWAPNYQVPSVDYATITQNLMKYFCMPNGIYLSLRLPTYKNLTPKSASYYKYIGFHNDAIYGETSKVGWHSGGYQYGTADWQQACEEGAYTPQGGELLNNGDYVKKGKIPVGIEVIKEMGHHWNNTMSVWHGMYEGTGDEEPIMEGWKKETVTPAVAQECQVVYDPYWFVDDNGSSVNRNAFEFLRDHLGYRISLQTLKISGKNQKGAEIKVQTSLKNYGFSAAFCMQSGFAILDSNYDVVSTVRAGNPSKWYSHNPENYLDTKILTHNVGAKLKLPKKSGKYYIAFYLKNGLNQFATLANDIDSAGGYALLHEFEIK